MIRFFILDLSFCFFKKSSMINSDKYLLILLEEEYGNVSENRKYY